MNNNNNANANANNATANNASTNNNTSANNNTSTNININNIPSNKIIQFKFYDYSKDYINNNQDNHNNITGIINGVINLNIIGYSGIFVQTLQEIINTIHLFNTNINKLIKIYFNNIKSDEKYINNYIEIQEQKI